MIDPEILVLFRSTFLEEEMKRHNIKSVTIDRTLWATKRTPGIFFIEERVIGIDTTVPFNAVMERLRRDNAWGLFPEIEEKEVFAFVFFHELAHADNIGSEWEANYFAKQQILKYRERMVNFLRLP